MTRSKIVNGIQIVEIKVDSVQQIFNSMDPTPFRRQSLDKAFVDYLETCANEISYKIPMQIKILVHNNPGKINAEIISTSIREYFGSQMEIKRSQFYKHLRTTRLFLFLGLSLLGSCLLAAHLLQKLESTLWTAMLREGIIIFGWVSMWRPLEVFIFDWYPLFDQRRYLKKLIASKVILEPTNS